MITSALEQARQCLGGHGYSAYSALPSYLQDYAVMCSWEGDNTVMAQQLAKFLMKCLKQAKEVVYVPLIVLISAGKEIKRI